MTWSAALRYRRLAMATIALAFILISVCFSDRAAAASWNGIEPFKSRRADVVQALGQPIGESADGVLRFAVMGGSVQVSFVNEKFVAAKKLRPELAGTVLEIVLQHGHSSDTPESLNLSKNRSFVRDDAHNITIYRNMKDGVVYTFIDGTLKTTRYTFADEQLSRARR